MFYRPIFKSAWLVTWRFKILWLFGLLASWGFLGSGGELNLFLRARNWLAMPVTAFPFWQGVWASGVLQLGNLVNFFKLAWYRPVVFVKLSFFLLLGIVFILVLVWLAMISQAILIKSATKLSQGGTFQLGVYFKTARQKFWRILFLNLIAKLLITFGIILLLLPFWLNLATKWPVFSLVFTLVGFLFFLPFVVIVGLVVKYAIQTVVLRDKDVWQALEAGRHLLAKNLLASLEMAIFFAFFHFVMGLGLFIVFLFASAPFLVMTAGSFLARTPAFFWTGLLATALVALLVLLWGGAVFVTFQWSAWTLFFERISKEKVSSKLERLIDKLFK